MTIEPPEAKQIPSPRTFHGDTVIDEYAWLADKDDPDTIDYLTAENAYTDAVTAHLDPLREQIFTEIKTRTQESDLSVPVRKGDWWHYSRTVEGKQYAVHCRRAVRPGEVIPPIPADAAARGFGTMGAVRGHLLLTNCLEDEVPAVADGCHTLGRLHTDRRLVALYRLLDALAVVALFVMFRRRGWLGQRS